MREAEHIAMRRPRHEGGSDFLSMPNHSTIKASTLRTILTQARRQPRRRSKMIDSTIFSKPSRLRMPTADNTSSSLAVNSFPGRTKLATDNYPEAKSESPIEIADGSP